MDLKSLSLPQRLLAGAGCVVILALVAAAALFLYWDRRAGRAVRAGLDQAPAGWVDSIRAAARIPGLNGLVAAHADSGDGAWVVYDTARAFRREGVDGAYRALVGSDTAEAADSALWRALAADTTLDRWAGAARAARWDATDRLLAMVPRDRPNFVLLPIPSYGPARDAARALVIRGIQRLERGDRAGARADLAAATGLGERMARGEPTYIGMLVGRATIASGLTGWQRYAVVVRDTALAARAERLRAWALARPVSWSGLLVAEPDTAIAIARDTTLALGTRAHALGELLVASLVRPRGLILGPPRAVREAIHDLTRTGDRDMARMAALAEATAERMNLIGLPGLLRDGGQR